MDLTDEVYNNLKALGLLDIQTKTKASVELSQLHSHYVNSAKKLAFINRLVPSERLVSLGVSFTICLPLSRSYSPSKITI